MPSASLPIDYSSPILPVCVIYIVVKQNPEPNTSVMNGAGAGFGHATLTLSLLRGFCAAAGATSSLQIGEQNIDPVSLHLSHAFSGLQGGSRSKHKYREIKSPARQLLKLGIASARTASTSVA
jgi:hypothetical protein